MVAMNYKNIKYPQIHKQHSFWYTASNKFVSYKSLFSFSNYTTYPNRIYTGKYLTGYWPWSLEGALISDSR
jgi:hypothetical protein